jgi:hypothetical protein
MASIAFVCFISTEHRQPNLRERLEINANWNLE